MKNEPSHYDDFVYCNYAILDILCHYNDLLCHDTKNTFIQSMT